MTTGEKIAIWGFAGVVIAALIGIIPLLCKGCRSESLVMFETTHTKQEKPKEESTTVKAEVLIDIIKEQQVQNVKESYGEMAYQCFTDADLESFIQTKNPARIAETLRNDNKFINVVLAIKKLTPLEQKNLLDSALKPLRPTWSQLGKIGREGQTEAGQKAEMLIARTIVDLVRELSKLSEQEIINIY